MAKVKNYNFNVTEVLVSDFKNAFPGILSFTVGILVATDQWSPEVCPIFENSKAKQKLSGGQKMQLFQPFGFIFFCSPLLPSLPWTFKYFQSILERLRVMVFP